MSRRGSAVLVLVLVLASCTSAPTASDAAGSSTPAPVVDAASEVAAPSVLRWGLEEPQSLVPGEAMDRASLTVVDALFDGLVDARPGGELRPAAAVSWRGDAALSTWTFTLQGDDGPGVQPTYHEDDLGRRERILARDFAYAWSRLVREGAAAAYLLEDVVGYDAVVAGERARLDGVEALDDRTLQVRLRRPDAAFPALAAHPALAPVSESLVEADRDAFATRPLGNGAFAMEGDWARGQFIRLRRVDAEGGQGLEEVLFDITSPNSAYVAFQQDRLDVAELPGAALDGARARLAPAGTSGDEAADRLARVPTNQLYYLGVRVDATSLEEVEVRRALSLAIDRERLAADVFRGLADPARGLVPPAIGDGVSTCGACRHDPGRARTLFAQAGIDSLEVWFNEGAGHEAVIEQVARDLRAVGVDVEPRTPVQASTGELAAYLATLREGRAPVFRFGWSTDRPDAADAIAPVIGSEGAGSGASGNQGGYADDDVDTLLAAAAGEGDTVERAALLREAERLALNRDQALVPLVTLQRPYALDRRVRNVHFDWLGIPDLERVTLVQ